MDNMDFYSKALAYHTKGRKAILEQTELEEKKCSCCDTDPCTCDDDCSCKSDVKEGADEVNDQNIDSIHDKEENEPVDNSVKKTEAMIAGKQPHNTPIEPIFKDYSNTSVEKQAPGVAEAKKGEWKTDSGWKKPETDRKDQFGNKIKTKNLAKHLAKSAAKKSAEMDEEKLLDMFEEFGEMFDNLADLFEEHDMDLIEGFEATTEDLVEDELSEDFRSMSKTKQLIARRRAGRRKKLTVGYKVNKNKFAK